jgi:hypothetical protein
MLRTCASHKTAWPRMFGFEDKDFDAQLAPGKEDLDWPEALSQDWDKALRLQGAAASLETFVDL